MVLQFLADHGRYNPYTDVVTFFAMDADYMVMFNVSRQSLEYLEDAPILTEGQFVAVFSKHRERILTLATALYHQRPRPALSLTKANFTD